MSTCNKISETLWKKKRLLKKLLLKEIFKILKKKTQKNCKKTFQKKCCTLHLLKLHVASSFPCYCFAIHLMSKGESLHCTRTARYF